MFLPFLQCESFDPTASTSYARCWAITRYSITETSILKFDCLLSIKSDLLIDLNSIDSILNANVRVHRCFSPLGHVAQNPLATTAVGGAQGYDI